ncbi:hypothetical protein ACI796_02290 [Geodermatophilus sp. SYSU D00525]
MDFDTHRLQIAFSWRIAAELCRRVPGHRVYETHPGGGQMDCLALRGPVLYVDINRLGSLHAPKVESDGPFLEPRQMNELALRPDGVEVVVDRVLGAHRIAVPTRRPRTDPDVLTYRVIAAVLAQQLFEGPWDCRSVFHDSSGSYGSGMPDSAPVRELAEVPANEIWCLSRGDDVVAHLHRGWAFTGTGERLDLMSRYDRGTALPQLVAELTRRPARRRAPALPQPSEPLRQAAPQWITGV